jgi:hypothetical protein
MPKLKYLGMKGTNQNCIYEEIELGECLPPFSSEFFISPSSL